MDGRLAGNLAWEIDELALHSALQACGTIESIRWLHDKQVIRASTYDRP
jgi:hypothetical protein